MFIALLSWLCLLDGTSVRAQEATEPPGQGTGVVDAAELSRAIRNGASQIIIESSITGIVGEQSANTSVFDLTRYNTFPELPESCLNDPSVCLEDNQYVSVTLPTVITSANNALVDFGFQRRRVILTQDITFQDITLQGIASDYSPYIFFFLFYNNSNLVCNNCVVEHACAGTDASFFLESMRLAELSQAQFEISEDRQSVSGTYVAGLAQDITQGTSSTQSFQNCTFRCNPDLLPREQAPIEVRPEDNCQSKEDAGLSYRGVQNTTMNGYTCQSWTSTTPNFHTRIPTAFPEAGLAENYCRNPDNEQGVWCYTTDGPRWERCSVPFCDPVTPPTPPPSGGSLSNGARNGIIAGVASVFCMVLLLLALILWRCCRRRQLPATMSSSETPATKSTTPYTGLPISDSCSSEAEKERSRNDGNKLAVAMPPVDTIVGLPHLVKAGPDDGTLPDGQKVANGVDSSVGGGGVAAEGVQGQAGEGGPRSNARSTEGSKDKDKDKDDSAHGPMRSGASVRSANSASSGRKSSLPAPMLELRDALAEMGSDAKQLQLHELVGKGGFGSVYRGTWRGLNVQVAVKTVTFQERASGGSAQQRAIAEAAITFSLTHPNVIATYFHDITPLHVSSTAGLTVVQDAAEKVQDWKLFLVQEFCEAGSLRRHIDTGSFLASSGKPKLGKSVGCLVDVARGMEYIQSRNIIHGDLNPSNILLRLLPGIASTDPPSSGPCAPVSVDSQMQSGVGQPTPPDSVTPSKPISDFSAVTSATSHAHTRGTASVAFGDHIDSNIAVHLAPPPATSTAAGTPQYTQHTAEGLATTHASSTVSASQADAGGVGTMDVVAHDLQLPTSTHASNASDSQAMHVATLAACDTLPQKLDQSEAKEGSTEMATRTSHLQMETESKEASGNAGGMGHGQEGGDPIAALKGVRNALNSTASVSAVSAVSEGPYTAAKGAGVSGGWAEVDLASATAPSSAAEKPPDRRRAGDYAKTPRLWGVPNAPRRPGAPVAEAVERGGTQGAQPVGVTAAGPVSGASSGEVDLGAAAAEAAARSLSSRGMDHFSSFGGGDALMSSMQFGSGNMDLDSGYHPSGMASGGRSSLVAPSSGRAVAVRPSSGAPISGGGVLPQHAQHAALWHRIHAVNAGVYDTSQTDSQSHSVAAPQPAAAAAAAGGGAELEPSTQPLESPGTPPMPAKAPSTRPPPPTSGGSKASGRAMSKSMSKSSRPSSSDRHTATSWDPEPWELCAKVSDFGLSVKMDPATGHVSNLRQGTPFYIAPEVRDQGHMSMAADSFAFGVMMWECYHSLAPYCAKRGGRIVKHPRFPEFPNECPLSFAVLSASCLAVDPRDRPNFMQICGVLEDLAAHLRGEGLPETCAAHLPMRVLENTAYASGNGEAEEARRLTPEQQAMTAISQILSRALPSSGKGSSEHSKPPPPVQETEEAEGDTLQDNELPSGAGIMPSAQELLSKVTSSSTAHPDVRNSRGTAGAMHSTLSSADGSYSSQLPSQTFKHYSHVAGMPMAPVDEASSASPHSADPASVALAIHAQLAGERAADGPPQAPAAPLDDFTKLVRPIPAGAEVQQAAQRSNTERGGISDEPLRGVMQDTSRPEAVAGAAAPEPPKDGRPPTHPGPWDTTPPGSGKSFTTSRGAPALRSGSRLPSQGGSPVGSVTSAASSDLFRRTGPRHTFAFPNEIVVEEREDAGDLEDGAGDTEDSAALPQPPAPVAAAAAGHCTLDPDTKQYAPYLVWEEQKSKRFIEHLRALRRARRSTKGQSADDGADSGSNFSVHASNNLSTPSSFNRTTGSAGGVSMGPDSPRLKAPRHLVALSQGSSQRQRTVDTQNGQGSTAGPLGYTHSTRSGTVATDTSLQHGQLDGIPYSVGVSCVSVGGLSGASYQESPLASPRGADGGKHERSMVSVPWSIGEWSVEGGQDLQSMTPTSNNSRAGFGTFMEAEVDVGEEMMQQAGTDVPAGTEDGRGALTRED